MIRYSVLTSGSCGNAYIFYDGVSAILIDMGLTVTGLKKRLEALAIPFTSLTDLYLTHMHPDHSKGAGALHRMAGVNVHVSEDSYKFEKSVFDRLGLKEEDISTFSFENTLTSGNFILKPFRTHHDSAGSSGYTIENAGQKFFLMTDTGYFTEEAVAEASSASVLFIESNYDERMLEEGPYPYPLKKRISGERGHLSNREAMEFVKSASPMKHSKVYFIHLSANNNTSALVEAAAVEALTPLKIEFTVCERGQGYEGMVACEEECKG